MDDIQASSSSVGSSHFPVHRSMSCSSNTGLKDPMTTAGSLLAGITVKEETVDFDAASSPDHLLLLAAQMPLPSRRRAYTRSGRSTAESSVCEVCQGELTRFDTLLQHKLLHFNTTHVCYVCDTYFVSVENLLLHMSGVHRDILGVYPKGDAFVCPICIQRFSSSKSLLRHQNLHARKEDFSCTICALDLLGCRALLTHLSSTHHKDMKVKIQSLFICIDCRSVFTSRDSYAFHMMMRAQNETCDTPHHESHHFNPSSSTPSDTKQLLLAHDSTLNPHHHPHPSSSSSSHHQHQHLRPNGDYHPPKSATQRVISEEGPRTTGTFVSPLNLSLAQRGPFHPYGEDGGSSRRERFYRTSPGLLPRQDHDTPDTDARRMRNGTGSTSEDFAASLSGTTHQTLMTDSESKGDSGGYERVMSRWSFEADLLQEATTGNARPLPKSLHKRSQSAQVSDDHPTGGADQSKRFRSSESAPPEVMKHVQTTNDGGGCLDDEAVPIAVRNAEPEPRKNQEEEEEEEDDVEEEHFRDNRSSSKSPPDVARYVGDGNQEQVERVPTEIDKYRGREGEGGGAGQGGREEGGNVESFPFELCHNSFGFRGRLPPPQHRHHPQYQPPHQQSQRLTVDKLSTGSSNGWQSSVDGSKTHFQTPRFGSGRLVPSGAMPRDAKNAGHCGGGGGLGGDQASAEDILAFVGANRDSLMMCRHCNVIYTDQIIYYLHMGLHNLNNPWQCNLCGKVCTNAQQFSSHVIHY